MKKTFWLRSETKANEFRRPLAPVDCETLIKAGHKVVVEDWKDSIIPIEEYQSVGCEIANSGSWVDSDAQNIIVGLKALPEGIPEFKHTHIYFAHTYKDQDGWSDIMSKFKIGGGKIIDLEFMVDENKRRVNAFGYWAGYVGAALGALFLNTNSRNEIIQSLNKNKFFQRKENLINFIKPYLDQDKQKAIIIGALGRSGKGATEALRELSFDLSLWDMQETAKGGPFKEILEHDLFVNCVLAMEPMAPFINKEILDSNKRLNIISDVSCDPDSDCNMVPLYEEATKLDNPLFRVQNNGVDLDIIAIDNLPSILPYESSLDFSSQLIKSLESYDENSIVIKNSLNSFYKTLERI